MSHKVVITEIGNTLSDLDLSFLPEDPTLVVGKKDKNLNVVEGGRITPISMLPTMLPSTNGYIKIPTQQGELIVQWGLATVPADSKKVESFRIPFTDRCLNITGSHKSNDPPVDVTVNHISATQLEIEIKGGVDNEMVHWIAIGI